MRCRGLVRTLVALVCLSVPVARAAEPGAESAEELSPSASADSGELPRFDPFGEPYRTPLSGEGFLVEVFGEEVEVPSRDRSRLVAWDIGAAFTIPGADENEVLPFASLYFWHNPGTEHFFRGVVVGLFNDLLYAYSPESWDGFELAFSLDNFNVPVEQGDLIDGVIDDSQKTTWGYIRPGIGFGYRRQIDPGEQDNLFTLTAFIEPGFYYFSKGDDAVSAFQEPQDTFDLRAHLQMRADALIRNLLELPQSGWAAGFDAVYGYRTNWESWGIARREDARERRDYSFLKGYLLWAGEVPGVDSQRHRIVSSIHGGVGADLDRFSAPRVGGGPHPFGEEFGSTSRPVLPGAAVEEFFPSHYAVAVAEYRYEPIFFTYLSLRASAGYLDRDRRKEGRIRREDDGFGSLGIRITSGFAFNTRVQLDYNYNVGIERRDSYGGHEIVFHISGQF